MQGNYNFDGKIRLLAQNKTSSDENDYRIATSDAIAALLGGSWVVISRFISISRATILLSHIRGLITPLNTTPEPPSKRPPVSQRLQYPLTNEYTLNYSRIPNMI